MENAILVSIIMSVYNEKEVWLRQAIESILNQTYNKYEFIIILDNPYNLIATKVIEEYKEKDTRIVFIKNDENIGLVKSLNKGLKIAKGEYIARMDADDISAINRIEIQIDYLRKNPDIGLVGCNWICIDEQGNELYKHGKLPENYNFIRNNIKYNNLFLHPSWMFKSSIAESIGGYREIDYAEDYDFICRVITSNIKITNLNVFLVLYRIRANSISLSKALQQQKNSGYLLKLFNERMKYGFDSFEIETLSKYKANRNEQVRFNRATRLFIKSREYKQNKKFLKFFFFFLVSTFSSKYRLIKNYNIALANIKFYIYRFKNNC